MSFRGRLLVFGYPALEILTAWGLAALIGWGWTVLLLLAGIPIGALMMRSASRSAMAELRTRAQTGIPAQGAGRFAVRFAAGLLLAVPGLWSDLLALLVLIPSTGRWLLRRLPTPSLAESGAWSWQVRTWAGERSTNDVVQGQVLNKTAGPPGEGGPAEDVPGLAR